MADRVRRLFKVTRGKGRGRGGGSWSTEMLQLAMEMLINDTPPSGVNPNIRAMAAKVDPAFVALPLPGLNWVRRVRRMLNIVVRALAAYRIGRAVRLSLPPPWAPVLSTPAQPPNQHPQLGGRTVEIDFFG